MIPLIRDEFVERQSWIDDKDITDVLAIAQSLPGVIAVNSATFLGYRLAGVAGALVCTVGVVLPSFLIIFAIAMLFASSGLDSNVYLLKFFAGVRPSATNWGGSSSPLPWRKFTFWASALPRRLSRRRCMPLPHIAFWGGLKNDLLGFIFCIL